MSTVANGQDPREYLDDLLDQNPEHEIAMLIKRIESRLLERSFAFGVQPTIKPKEKKPPAEYRKFTIMRGDEVICLGRVGDIVVCRLRYESPDQMPRTTPEGEKEGLIGKWFAFPNDKHANFMKLRKIGYKVLRGSDDRECVLIERRDVDHVYEVMEVQPGRDYNWRADKEFMQAMTMAGCLKEKTSDTSDILPAKEPSGNLP